MTFVECGILFLYNNFPSLFMGLNNGISQPPQNSHRKKRILGFIGIPGAGKDTQLENVERKLNSMQISTAKLIAGDESRTNPRLQQYKEIVKAGGLVPKKAIAEVLNDLMEQRIKYVQVLLKNGYPRDEGQIECYDEGIQKLEELGMEVEDIWINLTLADDPEEEERIAQDRILKGNRGREDDNVKALQTRFAEARKLQPVKATFKKRGKLIDVDASPPADQVQAKLDALVEELFGQSNGSAS